MRKYVFTEHALFEITRRGLTEEAVRGFLAAPEQQIESRPGRMVLRSRIEMGDPAKFYLIRVFVDTNREPAEVVTSYRTSRISKYWRAQP